MMGGRGYHIILIEDNKGDAHLLEEVLADTGLVHEVDWFRDGPSAIKFFSDGGAADLIILDLNLPGMSGLDLISFFTQQRICVETPIAVVTGSTYPEDIARAKRGCVDRYLIKPMTLKEMEDTTAALREMLLGERTRNC